MSLSPNYNLEGMSTLSAARSQVEGAPGLEPEQEAAQESLSRVVVHNDDVTPFEFVIVVLIRIFQLDTDAAERVAYRAHSTGLAQVAVLPLPVAWRRVGRAHFAAALEGYPLHFTVEPQ
jgi:ATP-dependent Clp protease adaptor protein ClpS